MELSDKRVVMIVQVGAAWVWKYVRAGEHGVVSDGDGECATRDEAEAIARLTHPDAEVMYVDDPRATY